MGLLSRVAGRVARGPIGGAAMGGVAGGAGAGALTGWDPNAMGYGAMIGAGAGLGMGAVGNAGRREMLEQISMGRRGPQVAAFIRRTAEETPERAQRLMSQLEHTDPILFREVQAILSSGAR